MPGTERQGTMIQKLEMKVLIDNLAEAPNSCSHAGMTNILADIREMLGRSDVCAYVGGLHLYKMTDEELDALSGEIDRTGIEHIFTGHCTGDHAFAFLKARLGERIEQFSSGFRYRFG